MSETMILSFIKEEGYATKEDLTQLLEYYPNLYKNFADYFEEDVEDFIAQIEDGSGVPTYEAVVEVIKK